MNQFGWPHLALNLIERALRRRLVGPPAQKLRAMAKTVIADVIVAYLRNQLRRQGLPFARAFRAPARRATRCPPGESRRLAQALQLLCQRDPIDLRETGRESHVIEFASL